MVAGDGDWEDARRAWPGVELDRAAYEAHVSAVVAELPPGTPLVWSDLYLACACALGVVGAHTAFERAFVQRVPAYLARVERDAAVVDEIAQRVRERLLVARPDGPPRIADYRGRGTLEAWVRVVALRLHATMAAEGARGVSLDDEADEVAPRLRMLAVSGQGADLAAAKEEHREAVERAVATALRELPARERTMLSMHYVDGLSLERIGKLYRVDKATISRWLRAARERIADEALARVQDETGATADEARSLLGLLSSTLDLSLGGLLAEDAQAGLGPRPFG
jgi:RNA polymerase sigma-70 factor (ECF subfamily)